MWRIDTEFTDGDLQLRHLDIAGMKPWGTQLSILPEGGLPLLHNEWEEGDAFARGLSNEEQFVSHKADVHAHHPEAIQLFLRSYTGQMHFGLRQA